MITAQRGKAVGEHDNAGRHLAFMQQTRGALGKVVAEILPGNMRQARTGESGHVHQHRKVFSLAFPGTLIVLRRQPHRELAYMRIAQRVVAQDPRVMLQHHHCAGLPLNAFKRHSGFSIAIGA